MEEKMAFDTPTPAKGATPRKVTDARGGHITPEGAKPRMSGPNRGKYPKGPELTPENYTWRKSGDSQENTLKSEFVTPPAVGNMDGKSRTLDNPVK